MEGHCSTGESPKWAVVPMEEEELKMRKVTKLSLNTAHSDAEWFRTGG